MQQCRTEEEIKRHLTLPKSEKIMKRHTRNRRLHYIQRKFEITTLFIIKVYWYAIDLKLVFLNQLLGADSLWHLYTLPL